jgi:predicted nucleic-acid-binding Zn-ribbon protein
MNRKIKEQFIQEAIVKHGNKYDYSAVEYINGGTKVRINCPSHGEFEQIANHHSRGRGCPKCGNKVRSLVQVSSKEDFIEKAIAVHGDKYNYSVVEYVNSQTKITINCPVHGDFEQSPNPHLQGHGCPKCGRELTILAQSSSSEEFTQKAIAVHKDKFDYSQVKYINDSTKVKIGCFSHGFFEQRPNDHLRGKGCRQCASYGFNPTKSAILYLLKFQKDFATFWKIGITNRTVEKRFGGESKFITERNIWKYENGGDAYSIEQKVLAAFAKYKIEMPLFTLLDSNGDTECFVSSLPVQKVVNFIKKAYN